MKSATLRSHCLFAALSAASVLSLSCQIREFKNNSNSTQNAFNGTDLELSELPKDYTSWSAEKKQSFIWDKVVKSSYEILPALDALNPVKALASNPTVTMNHTGDAMPPEIINKEKLRERVIHIQGVLFKVKFVPIPGAAGGYTGTLGQGAKYGIVRFSHVGKVGGPVGGVTPGIGLKFFVDGSTSPSLVAMYTLDGQGPDFNMFTNDFYTVVPKTDNGNLKLIDKRFQGATDNRTGQKLETARRVSAEPFSEVLENGTKVTPRKTPRILKFVPNPKLTANWGPNGPMDFRTRLTDPSYIAKGDLIYTVFACETHVEERETCGYTPLGELFADSEGIASRFGDKAIFFNHRAYSEKDFDNY